LIEKDPGEKRINVLLLNIESDNIK